MLNTASAQISRLGPIFPTPNLPIDNMIQATTPKKILAAPIIECQEKCLKYKIRGSVAASATSGAIGCESNQEMSNQ
jgi:hypothetical protein